MLKENAIKIGSDTRERERERERVNGFAVL